MSLIIGGVLFLLNIVFGVLLSGYQTFNCVLNCGVIVLFVVMQYMVSAITLKDAYRISFNCLFPVFSIVEYICGLFSKESLADNLSIVIILLIVVLQIVLLTAVNYVSKSVE